MPAWLPLCVPASEDLVLASTDPAFAQFVGGGDSAMNRCISGSGPTGVGSCSYRAMAP